MLDRWFFDINFLKTRFARQSGFEPNGIGYSFQSTWIRYDTSITPALIDKIANQERIIGPDVEMAEADLPGSTEVDLPGPAEPELPGPAGSDIASETSTLSSLPDDHSNQSSNEIHTPPTSKLFYPLFYILHGRYVIKY